MPRSDRPLIPPAPFPSEDLESYETKPPPLDAVLWLMLSHAEVVALSLDAREERLLSMIDGRTNVEAITELAEMPPSDVRRLLARWLATGIVKLRELPESSSPFPQRARYDRR